jgi:hypothetical protein
MGIIRGPAATSVPTGSDPGFAQLPYRRPLIPTALAELTALELLNVACGVTVFTGFTARKFKQREV